MSVWRSSVTPQPIATPKDSAEALRLEIDKTDAYLDRVNAFEESLVFGAFVDKVIIPESRVRSCRVVSVPSRPTQMLTGRTTTISSSTKRSAMGITFITCDGLTRPARMTNSTPTRRTCRCS